MEERPPWERSPNVSKIVASHRQQVVVYGWAVLVNELDQPRYSPRVAPISSSDASFHALASWVNWTMLISSTASPM